MQKASEAEPEHRNYRLQTSEDRLLTRRSDCPIACSLDVIGDKWTLLVLRDIVVFKKTRFEEFLESPEKISTNILTDRLH
ncbi:winged helix-turn-helix transcriptional regulator, partial [Acinetobacter baumannii]